jgi:SNF2 family DNA or RNA helicase
MDARVVSAYEAGCQSIDLEPHADYQVNAIHWQLHNELVQHQGGILAHDPGLGKSAMMLTTLVAHPMWPTLIFAPVSCVDEWAKLFRDKAPGVIVFKLAKDLLVLPSNVQVLLAPTSCLQRGYGRRRADDLLPPCLRQHWARVVFDEAHYIRNAATKTYKALMAVARAADIRWAVTGTPTNGKRDDLLNIGAFVDEKLKSLTAVRSVMLRQTKEDVAREGKLYLPELTCRVELLDMSPEERSFYDEVCRLQGAHTAMLTRSTDCVMQHVRRQICTHPRLAVAYGDRVPGLQVPAALEQRTSTKVQRMLAIVTEAYAAGRKVLVLVEYRAEMDLVHGLLGELGIAATTFHGDTPAARRSEVIEEMRSEAFNIVLLMQVRAGGVGINLEAVEVVVVLSPDHDPMTQVQAMQRAHRVTSRQAVTCHLLAMRNTVEHDILAQQQAKAVGITAMTADDSWERSLGLQGMADQLPQLKKKSLSLSSRKRSRSNLCS